MMLSCHLELDFDVLGQLCKRLKPFLKGRQVGVRTRKNDSKRRRDTQADGLARFTATIDFRDGAAQRALSSAILEVNFGVSGWDIPPHRMCPPIPNRFEYVTWIRNLLALCDDDAGQGKCGGAGGVIAVPGDEGRLGSGVRGIDIGTGASCVFPILGAKAYGWSWLASEIDDTSTQWARRNIAAAGLKSMVHIRRLFQSNGGFGSASGEDDGCLYALGAGIGPLRRLLRDSDGEFDFCMTNPPFFEDSLEYAQDCDDGREYNGGGCAIAKSGNVEHLEQGNNTEYRAPSKAESISEGKTTTASAPDMMSKRKRRKSPSTACTGAAVEMTCAGGEVAFVGAIIRDSFFLGKRVRWYTAMLGKKSSLRRLLAALRASDTREPDEATPGTLQSLRSLTNSLVPSTSSGPPSSAPSILPSSAPCERAGALDVRSGVLNDHRGSRDGGTRRWVLAWSFHEPKVPAPLHHKALSKKRKRQQRRLRRQQQENEEDGEMQGPCGESLRIHLGRRDWRADGGGRAFEVEVGGGVVAGELLSRLATLALSGENLLPSFTAPGLLQWEPMLQRLSSKVWHGVGGKWNGGKEGGRSSDGGAVENAEVYVDSARRCLRFETALGLSLAAAARRLERGEFVSLRVSGRRMGRRMAAASEQSATAAAAAENCCDEGHADCWPLDDPFELATSFIADVHIVRRRRQPRSEGQGRSQTEMVTAAATPPATHGNSHWAIRWLHAGGEWHQGFSLLADTLGGELNRTSRRWRRRLRGGDLKHEDTKHVDPCEPRAILPAGKRRAAEGLPEALQRHALQI